MKNWLDRALETSSTALADRAGRRSFIGRVGVLLTGAALVPLLPVVRFNKATAAELDAAGVEWSNEKNCDYWAYCATDGWLCSCCGGTTSTCPPGTQPSPIAWVGTCRNPGDGKNYVVSYNDCCGASQCQQCYCNRNEGDTPKYQPQRSNAVTWCYGGVAPTYHCTVSRVMAVAE
jgi:methylamine dehydrogenase light chain